MAQPVIQTAFHSGEWAPALNARVDLQKYHSAVELAENFFVDYRGGLSTKSGSQFVLQCKDSSRPVRMITFQASASLNYILEFGEFYIRFYTQSTVTGLGAPVVESGKTITGATQANPGVITAVGHGYSTGDWVFISGIVGMIQLNNRYFRITRIDADHFSLQKMLDGSNVNTTSYTAYSSGGTSQRVYTLGSPYAAADLALLKFTQSVNKMIFNHPSYVPYVLTLIAATNWTMAAIVFGSSIPPPSAGLTIATTAGGAINVSYVVTSVDVIGQESAPSAVQASTTTGNSTFVLSWTAVSGASSYNVYRTQWSGAGVVPTGAAFGFVGNTTGVSFIDPIINSIFVQPADFAQTPPIPKNPFQGAGVDHADVTSAGTYTTVPTITFAAAPAGGSTATGFPSLTVQGTPTVAGGGNSFVVGDSVTFTGGVTLIVATVSFGAITAFQPITFPGSVAGSISSGSTPTNPVSQVSTSGIGKSAQANLTWGVGFITMTAHGAGYTSVPAITFSAGAATATAVLEASTAGNPSVPGYFDQRLFLAAKPTAVQSFDASQPGIDYNFNISSPLQPDDALSGTLKSQQLNTIKALIPMSSGLIILADGAVWLLNGGSAGAPVSAIDAAANKQSYTGIGDVPPIVANFDVLYIPFKGNSVRDLTFNFYTNIYTGTDITILSSHLFYEHTIVEWAYAEEPLKLVHAVRDDGVLLCLTFLKEQELIGWTHWTTDGAYKSVATAVESTSVGKGDFTYVVVQRTIGGNSVKYVERVSERMFFGTVNNAWCVDSGLRYSGSPATSFSGGEHLAGKIVTGLADGQVITPFTMNSEGTFTLATPASLVVVGLPYTCKMKTLAIDVGQPTVQSREKTIPAVTLRVAETLGLKIGRTFGTLVQMKDLVRGNVGSMTNEMVTNLVTGDAKQIIDASWTVQGQYCIQQDEPLPASILGVIPFLGDLHRAGG